MIEKFESKDPSFEILFTQKQIFKNMFSFLKPDKREIEMVAGVGFEPTTFRL